MRLALLALAVIVTTACAPVSPPATSTPRPVISTQAPATLRPATPTPAPNYRELRAKLVSPLGAMIIAKRGGNSNDAADWLMMFNMAADEVMPLIKLDSSVPASLLQSAIVSVRREPGNLRQLEQIRERLVLEIP